MKEIIITTAAKFALKCQYEDMVKWNLYAECAEVCGVEYDPDHDDWMLEGEPAYDESPNNKWEKIVQAAITKETTE
jgi:hypothetical protein